MYMRIAPRKKRLFRANFWSPIKSVVILSISPTRRTPVVKIFPSRFLRAWNNIRETASKSIIRSHVVTIVLVTQKWIPKRSKPNNSWPALSRSWGPSWLETPWSPPVASCTWRSVGMWPSSAAISSVSSMWGWEAKNFLLENRAHYMRRVPKGKRKRVFCIGFRFHKWPMSI